MTRRSAGAVLVALAMAGAGAPAQTRRAGQVTEPARFDCPTPLGTGVVTERVFCDVLIGHDPAGGIVIPLPPHTGDVTIRFDLHNRHTYSEDLLRANRAYRKYTATIGVMTADVTLLTRAVVQNEFRAPGDLLDRVTGGAGPGGVKAVAPTGLVTVTLTIPAEEDSVSILGEKLTVVRPDASDAVDHFTSPGRPIAIISNVELTYRPGPARRRRG
ncbi:MAG: hypothetical protein FJW23_15695 [Acidimicrobiia bacterium]|nr:hypothetical protein [Acidimicrobiia bacterium]